MAAWSNLPVDLLHMIAKRLDSHFDLLRFRSVCSSWRSSTPSKPRSISSHLPILPTAGISEITWAFYLSKRSILRVGLPDPAAHTTPSSWLIKIEEDPSGVIRLINPLTTFKFRRLPPDFPKPFDFSELRVFELGEEYVLEYKDYSPPGNVDAGSLYMEKVAFCSGNGDDFWLLTIHLSGKLAIFRRGDKKWTVIDDMQSPYDDVTYFDGKFYAVDNTGRTVLVDVADDGSSPVVKLAANSVFGGDKKCLVESEGDLLLVDTYFSMYLDDDDEQVRWMIERMIHFKVFRLDQRAQKWVEVQSLGDRLLFLGDDSSFSARASDFHGCKGNSICFTNISFFSEDEDASRGGTIGVFDLDTGSIGPLSSYANYSRAIWPPPAWVSSISEFQDT